ncbi:MAG: MBL fold metallo-hydrolase [Phycisphaerales bacterium]
MTLRPNAEISRRGFLGLGVAASAGLAILPRGAWALQPTGKPAATKPAAKKLFEWKSLHAKAWAAIGQGGNTLVLSDAGKTLLIDTKMPVFGAILRREAESTVGKLTMVLNTHHHADHTGGNHAFTKDLPLLAHKKAEPRIAGQVDRYIAGIKSAVGDMTKAQPAERELVADDFKKLHDRMADLHIKDFAPTQTFEDGHELSVGGLKIKLHHFGAGHTDNDAVVHIPSINLVHTGDLLFYKTYPYIDREGGATTVGWRASLRKVIELCDDKTIIVPGHGEVCTKAALSEQIEYFDRMCEFVGKQIKDGKSREDVANMNPEPYDKYTTEWIRPITLRGIFEELSEKK